jgi:hypothetical protein
MSISMAEAVQPSRAAEYRDTAAKLRQFARETRFDDSRNRLLALAESFEALATRVEAWQTAGPNTAV